MHTILRSKAGFLALLAPCFVASCTPEMSSDVQTNNEDLESQNGFTMNGFTMNGFTMNGLSSVNGLSSTTGLMTTSGGRQIIQYMVKCAYPAGQSLVQKDQY